MPNDPRPKTYLADAVYVSLRRALVAGDFDPGEPLTEAELCRRFDVSRTPVREALAKLERDQLVRVVPKKGAFVRALSHAEIRELYQLREALEALAVRLAAPRVERAELEDFGRRFRELRGRGQVAHSQVRASCRHWRTFASSSSRCGRWPSWRRAAYTASSASTSPSSRPWSAATPAAPSAS